MTWEEFATKYNITNTLEFFSDLEKYKKTAAQTCVQPTPVTIEELIIQGAIGSKKQQDAIQAHMDEYFTRWPSYRKRFTDLEWYHIFLDFHDSLT